MYRATAQHIDKRSEKSAKYYLVIIEPEKSTAELQTFRASESERANTAYTEAERRIPKNSAMQVVLVSVDSVAALKNAYPNFFGDTRRFSKVLEDINDYGKV
jgi:hypothetical protein